MRHGVPVVNPSATRPEARSKRNVSLPRAPLMTYAPPARDTVRVANDQTPVGVPVPPAQTAPTSYPDVDPAETQEWLESLDALVEHAGPRRARYVVQRLLQHAGESGVPV